MKHVRLLPLFLALLMLGMTACGKAAPAPAEPSAPAANAEAKAAEAPAPTAAPTPEPTAEPTPEPTPEPRPFSIGTISDDVYRNEFFGFELDYYPLSMEQYFLDSTYSSYEERSETTTTEEVSKILQAGKTCCDLHLKGGASVADSAATRSAELRMTKSTYTAVHELNRALNYMYKLNNYVAQTDLYPLTIGDQEWTAIDFLCSYKYHRDNGETGINYCYTRLLVCSYNGYCATFEIEVRSSDVDPTYEVAKPLLDEFCAALQPISEEVEATPGKPFTMGVLTDELYRSDYLGIEIPFGELGYDEDIQSWKYEYPDVCIIRDYEMTDEKAAEIIANGDTFYVDMGADTYRSGGRIEGRISVRFDRARTHYLQDPSDDRVLGRTTMTIGDREWEVTDQSYDHWSGWYLVYERYMVTYQDNVKAQLIISFQINKSISAPYEDVKITLDEICATFRPVEDSAPAPTSKPLATPEPEPEHLDVKDGAVLLEAEGLKLTASNVRLDWKGDLLLLVTVKNTTDEVKYIGVPSMGKYLVNGVNAATEVYGHQYDVKPNISTSFSLELAVSEGSLAGITAKDIQEIQIPFTLYKTRDLGGGSYTYDVIKDLGYAVLKVGNN